jgi:hypothetical protein
MHRIYYEGGQNGDTIIALYAIDRATPDAPSGNGSVLTRHFAASRAGQMQHATRIT